MRGLFVGLGLCAALSGCVIPVAVPLAIPLPRAASKAHPLPATDSTEVMGGEIALAAPEGYCVDPGSRQDGPEGAFVLWGSCAAIGQDPEGVAPEAKVMLSATIGPQAEVPVEGSFAHYQAFFATEAGRAALARSGLAQDVNVLDMRAENGLLLLKIADASAPTVAPVDAVYWRAITGLGGRVSALSVLPLAGNPLDDEAQLALLLAFDERIRAANGTLSESAAAPLSSEG